MRNQRRPDEFPLNDYIPGDFGRWRGRWFARTPNGLLGNLSSHDVTEHEDGTITVSPSILVDAGPTQYHGYLERGIWRIC